MENMVEFLETEDFEKVCRTCLRSDLEMRSIFAKDGTEDEKNSISLRGMILACTKTSVSDTDGLPGQMCTKCVLDIKSSYEFKQKCEESFSRLQTLIAEKNLNDFEEVDESIFAQKSQPIDDVEKSISRTELPNEKSTQTNEVTFHPCEMCDEKFMRLEDLRLHRINDHDRQGFTCRVCQKVYSRLSHLRRHMIQMHPDATISTALEAIICSHPGCGKQFVRHDHLRRHVVRHKINKFQCKKCMEIFMKEDALDYHRINCTGKIETVTVKEEIENEDDLKNESLSTCEDDFDMSEEELKPKRRIRKIKVQSDQDSEKDDDTEGEDSDYVDEEYQPQDDEELTDDEPLKRIEKAHECLDESQIVTMKVEPLDVVHDSNDKDKNVRDSSVKNVKPKKRRYGNRTYECNECGEKFNTTYQVNAHKKNNKCYQKVGNPNECTICGKAFKRASHLRRHQLVHLETKPFQCPDCDKTFARMDNFKSHCATHMAIKGFDCYRCGFACGRPGHFRSSRRTGGNTSNEPVNKPRTEQCDVCKKSFTSKKYLLSHMKIHEESSLTCKYCKVVMDNKKSFSEHIKIHNHEKPFLCSECGLRFIRNDYLVIHMRRHKGEKPFKCKYCGKGFPRSTDLSVHERYHTGEKSHLCTTCGKGFNRAYNLVVHMRVHTGERPYKCTHCSKSFAQGNDLKAHIRRHTGERFRCDICNEGFIQGYHLTQHKRNVHGIDARSHIRRVEKFLKGTSEPLPIAQWPNPSDDDRQIINDDGSLKIEKVDMDVGMENSSVSVTHSMEVNITPQEVKVEPNVVVDGVLTNEQTNRSDPDATLSLLFSN